MLIKNKTTKINNNNFEKKLIFLKILKNNNLNIFDVFINSDYNNKSYGFVINFDENYKFEFFIFNNFWVFEKFLLNINSNLYNYSNFYLFYINNKIKNILNLSNLNKIKYNYLLIDNSNLKTLLCFYKNNKLVLNIKPGIIMKKLDIKIKKLKKTWKVFKFLINFFFDFLKNKKIKKKFIIHFNNFIIF